MEHVQLSGSAYTKFSRAVFRGRRGSDLGDLTLWHQPLVYFPGTNLLHQTSAGPCGIFAVLEAQIVVQLFSGSTNVDLDLALRDSVLDLLSRVSPHYVFCVNFDHSRQTCDFDVTDSRDMAHAFLLERDYLAAPRAALLLTLGVIFAAAGLAELRLPDEPYIEEDQYAALIFVMLMLNGTDGDDAIEALKEAGFVSNAQKEIGIKVLRSRIPGVRGTWLNPMARFFVCHSTNHFITVVMIEGAPAMLVFDTLQQGKVYQATAEQLNWI
jgi:hypothetical protein